ncbi:MAG TPA: DNA endonuclease SmrA, partial [Idiomarina abyssalis]|nr:DNA endonuclease SmrA [Idiomarina abyssalis]
AQKERRRAAEAEEAENENFLSTEYVDLVEPDDVIEFHRDGVQAGVFKRLKQGRYSMEASLNLHHHTLAEARTALFNFVKDCHAAGVRTALIIHGMGKHTKPHPALIKSYVNKWLRELEPVLAFHSAQRPHGGRGAAYIMMKKNAEQKQKNREKHAKR